MPRRGGTTRECDWPYPADHRYGGDFLRSMEISMTTYRPGDDIPAECNSNEGTYTAVHCDVSYCSIDCADSLVERVTSCLKIKMSAKARLITKMLVSVRSFFVMMTEVMTRPLPKRPIIARPIKIDEAIARLWKATSKFDDSTGVSGLVSIFAYFNKHEKSLLICQSYFVTSKAQWITFLKMKINLFWYPF